MKKSECNKICDLRWFLKSSENITCKDICILTENKLKIKTESGSILLKCQPIENIKDCKFDEKDMKF